MPQVIKEGRYTGEFIVSEANGHRSREQVVLLAGENLEAGSVLGRTLAGAVAAAQPKAGNTGNGVMGAITVDGAAKIGQYLLTITAATANAGSFTVEDPDGIEVGNGDVAAAFEGGGLSFTLADGAVDFGVGDGFVIAVSGGTEKYKQWNPASDDGSADAVAVLYDNVDATDGDHRAVVICRDAEVNGQCLAYFEDAEADDIALAAAQLAKRGIVVR
ncbi:head decoration protein [Dongia soli]|uniref:Head decoration protein n=1 Tax=Dongia soli TaxID=600628 RepID=A0ABU5E8D3_9PROT|nr:head decoration protein [Dongia soli]MDY0882300.1 head decoration protein [Dongia soli]